MSEDKQRLLKLLTERASKATYIEFRELYERFKDHDEAVAALRRGVDQQSKTVDSGSYCEKASYDYKDWWNKNEMLNDIDLAKGFASDQMFLNAFNPAALSSPSKSPKPQKGNDVLERLLFAVERLSERVEALEQRKSSPPPSAKYKL